MAQDWLSLAGKRHGGKVALIYGERRWRYADLNRVAALMAACLVKMGLKRGDSVGVLLKNCPEYIFLIHAAARLGVILVTLNTRLTHDELAWQAEQADCKFVIGGGLAQSVTLEALMVGDVRNSEAYLTGEIDLDNVQAVVFTSGTTGQPKGAQITFNNHYWSATASAERLGVDAQDRWLLCLPLYHIGGLAMVMRSCLQGTGIVLQAGFDVVGVWDALMVYQCTHVSLVPTMLYRLLNAYPDEKFPESLRLVLLGGAAASEELLDMAHARGIAVASTYGMTEATSQIATMEAERARQKVGSVGKSLPHVSVSIVDEKGDRLANGQHGEIVVQSSTVMYGYLGQAPLNGVLYTGDIGYLDADGDLWLLQRRSDLIVSGGENIYPAEIEKILRAHPHIDDVCVVGVPDAEWGQKVVAAIQLKAGMILSEADVSAYARERLGGYKIPRLIKFVDALPMTASGKVARKAISALFEEN